MKEFRRSVDDLVSQLSAKEPMEKLTEVYSTEYVSTGETNYVDCGPSTYAVEVFDRIEKETLSPDDVRRESRKLLNRMAEEGNYKREDRKKIGDALGYSSFKMKRLSFTCHAMDILCHPFVAIVGGSLLALSAIIGAVYLSNKNF